MRASRYSDFLEAWFEGFGDRFKVVLFEDLRSDPAAVVQDLLEWLDLPARDLDVTPQNATVTPRNHALHTRALRVRRKAAAFRTKHPRAHRTATWLYERANTRRGAPRLDDSRRARIAELYADSNRELVTILRRWGVDRLPPWLGE
jgi:hypothetical protein